MQRLITSIWSSPTPSFISMFSNMDNKAGADKSLPLNWKIRQQLFCHLPESRCGHAATRETVNSNKYEVHVYTHTVYALNIEHVVTV